MKSVLAVLLLVPPFALAQDCDALQSRWKGVVAAAEPMVPVARLDSYLRFLDTVPDDPEDCVRGLAIREIGAIESRIVQLRVGAREIAPARVMHCSAIDPITQRCTGPEADDTALVPETHGRSKAKSPPPKVATVQIPEAYQGKIETVAVAATAALQDGNRPLMVKRRGARLDLKVARRLASPVLIVVVRRNDSLGFRKFVWYL
jgi:hypothetical protein